MEGHYDGTCLMLLLISCLTVRWAVRMAALCMMMMVMVMLDTLLDNQHVTVLGDNHVRLSADLWLVASSVQRWLVRRRRGLR